MIKALDVITVAEARLSFVVLHQFRQPGLLLACDDQLANQRTSTQDLLLAGLHASLDLSPLDRVRGKALSQWSMFRALLSKFLGNSKNIDTRRLRGIALRSSAETPGYTNELLPALYHAGRFTGRLV